ALAEARPRAAGAVADAGFQVLVQRVADYLDVGWLAVEVNAQARGLAGAVVADRDVDPLPDGEGRLRADRRHVAGQEADQAGEQAAVFKGQLHPVEPRVGAALAVEDDALRLRHLQPERGGERLVALQRAEHAGEVGRVVAGELEGVADAAGDELVRRR